MGLEAHSNIDGDSARLRGTSRFSTVAHHIYLFSAIGHFLFIGLFSILGVLPLALYNIGSTLLFLLCIYLNRKERFRTAFLMAGIEVFVHSTLCAALIGWATGFHYFIVGIIPFAILIPGIAVAPKVTIAITVFASYGVVYFLTTDAIPPYQLDSTVESILNFTNLGIAFGAFTLLVHYLHTASVYTESKIQSVSQTDQLTCLPNRRGMESHLASARAALAHTGEPFSVLLGDLDHFKRVNDQYGHACGDSVLIAVAQALSAPLRSRDVVCRWGGEEFLVLLPATGGEGTARVAAKLLQSVRKITVSCGSFEITATITIGGATARQEMDNSRLVSAADRALYDAKSAGRDRYVIASQD